MAARGSPMGILMIAAGVVFLNLAYTGRGHDVWNALMGGGVTAANGSSQGAGSTNPNPPPANTGGIPVGATWAGGEIATIVTTDTCPSGFFKVNGDDGSTLCVKAGDASIARWPPQDRTGMCGNFAGGVISGGGDVGRHICYQPAPASVQSTPIGPTSNAGQATISGGVQPRYVSAIYPPSPGWHVV